MDPEDVLGGLPGQLVKLLLAWLGGTQDPTRWKASCNGTKIGPLSEAKCGLDNQVFWCRFRVKVDQAERTIEGRMPVTGGEETILLDGADVQMDDVVLASKWVGLGPVLVIKLRFVAEGVKYEYRFDGKTV